ncbi:MAG: hypothetical protein KBF56_02355 [Gemmatimonadaceae bacterium]|nr:hypothetical protein [Gemmatimonadaceae bacterium]
MNDADALLYRVDDLDARCVGDMARGRAWTDLSDGELAHEAWSLPWTSDAGFLALLPAYARAAVRSEHTDLIAALWLQLDPDTNSDRLGRVVPRMSPAQRAAVFALVALLEPTEASSLRYWQRSVERPDPPPWNEAASHAIEERVVEAFPAVPFAAPGRVLVGVQDVTRFERARRALEGKTWREVNHLDVALRELTSQEGFIALLPFALHVAVGREGPAHSVFEDLSPTPERASVLAELAAALTPAQRRVVLELVRWYCGARFHDGTTLAFWEQ